MRVFRVFSRFSSMKKMLRYLVIRAADGLGLGDGLVDGVWMENLGPGNEGFCGVLVSGYRKR